MQEQLLQYIESEKLCLPNAKILCAVSGGIDSMVMLVLLKNAGFEVAVAHCNFGLRGLDSDQDEVFVRDFCSKIEIPFFTQRFDTQTFAQQQKVSTQMAARTLRYGWFAEILSKHRFDYLATAHHQNDVLETVLLNLTKGTGLAGLHGIKSKNENVIRPMLFATKTAIEQFAHEHQLLWREDSSNASAKYQRNLLRLDVIPLLKKINPNLEQTFTQTVERLASAERVFNQVLENYKAKYQSQEGQHILIDLTTLGLAIEISILHEWLKPFGFNYAQSQQIKESLGAVAGKTFFSENYMLVKDRNRLVISPINERTLSQKTIKENTNKIEIEEGKYLQFCQIPAGKIKLQNIENEAFIDFNKLIFPLLLRPWQSGDSFCPLGMQGRKKKISDLLIDLKIPRNLKAKVLVLVNGNQEIIWVVGYRLDNRYKITEQSSTAFWAKMG